MNISDRRAELAADIEKMQQRLSIAQANTQALQIDIYRLEGALALCDEQLFPVEKEAVEA
tara:strand:- start:31 stop:210 length:180 start_codon:yes stop_codon:yes gene_type:complete